MRYRQSRNGIHWEWNDPKIKQSVEWNFIVEENDEREKRKREAGRL